MICEESSVAHNCSLCDQVFHVVCGGYREDSEGFWQNVTCNLCVRKNGINIQREGEKFGQRKEAHKMASLSNSRLPAVDIWTNVVVRVSDVDRGSLAPKKYPSSRRWCQIFWSLTVGHEESVLERLYARNEFTTADNFIDVHDVPSNLLSLRSASMTSRSYQGFTRSNCKTYYIDDKCNCCSKNIKCNSKCHSSSFCKN
jgi:hypothetical protein